MHINHPNGNIALKFRTISCIGNVYIRSWNRNYSWNPVVWIVPIWTNGSCPILGFNCKGETQNKMSERKNDFMVILFLFSRVIKIVFIVLDVSTNSNAKLNMLKINPLFDVMINIIFMFFFFILLMYLSLSVIILMLLYIKIFH